LRHNSTVIIYMIMM